MRILAIRGRNLASLAGPFEVCLDAPPLAGAGLFAITGRTGAGKSTILDALCLALYDRVPRLIGGSGAEVGRADDDPATRLRASDVRNILRRGTGEGFAEVDFRGMDARRYRARWSVRRARARADGRHQAQEMGLTDLDSGDDLGGTKTEVLAAIESRLGLTFDQFRRSVLLPQGDFAAFLRASAKERAELLERITGTEIYGRLSIAAHERARAETEALKLAEQRLGEHRPLDAEARAVLEAELAEAAALLAGCREHQGRLREAQTWYETRDRLAAERGEAQAALTRAEENHTRAEPRRTRWQRVRALQPLRLPLANLDRTRAGEAETREVLNAARAEAEQAQAEVAEAEAARETAILGLSATEQARRDAAPRLAAARDLDTRIQGAGEQLEKARQARESAAIASRSAEARLADLTRRRDAADQVLAAADAWLAERAGLAPIALQWEAWERELRRYAKARDERETAREIRDQADTRAVELAAERERASVRAVELAARREAAETGARALEQQAQGLDLERLAGERERLRIRADDLAARLRLVQQAGESRATLAKHRAALAETRERQQSLAKRRQSLAEALGPLRAALVEAEAASERLRLASAERVEGLRGQLAEGEPCPVCGSVEHPWVDQGSDQGVQLLKDLSREQERRVGELRAKAESLTREESAVAADSANAERRAGELAGEVEAGQARLAQLLADWSACPEDALRPGELFEPGLAERIAAERETIEAERRRVGEDEARGRALLREVEQARVAIEALRKHGDAAADALRASDEAIAANARQLEAALADARRGAETLATIAGLLVEPFAGEPDWRSRLDTDPVAFVDGYRAAVREWRTREAEREQQRRDRQALEPALAEASAGRDAEAGELARRTAAAAEQERILAGLHGERARCLDGRAADAVEQELEARIATARVALESVRQTLEAARGRRTVIDGRIQTLSKALAGQAAEHAEAKQRLDTAMQTLGVGLDALREALKRDAAWVETERAELDTLDTARRDAAGLLAERERRLDEHGATAVPDWPAEVLDESLRTAAAELEQAQTSWASLHGRRDEDERRRETSAALHRELEDQKARWSLWESLRGLIGSADGARFRTFAQGLTLEALVAHANVHLADLARRYALQRVPGAAMELQVVDREMGDEVRGIQSLSGGEGFLVSLALALGLASLASDRVQVESLFIDEGFGALDADSLDIALASLDALYGLGRQVGVISHVGTLVERIGARVQIDKQGGGRSRVTVLGG